jgi:hypothetical protein
MKTKQYCDKQVGIRPARCVANPPQMSKESKP